MIIALSSFLFGLGSLAQNFFRRTCVNTFLKEMKSRVFLIKLLFLMFAAGAFLTNEAPAQENNAPNIVRPGRPGADSTKLPSTTRGKLPPQSKADVDFMQGMIMHHGQAVEMTALIASRTKNPDVIKIGAKISQSQIDEIAFMKRWLIVRGEDTSMPEHDMSEMDGMDMGNHKHHMLMPGMLTPKQMEKLREATGTEFDKLFLSGMIQHHEGALVMVKELFSAAGAGQDAEIFNFATDVDSGQRGEIGVMRKMLEKLSK